MKRPSLGLFSCCPLWSPGPYLPWPNMEGFIQLLRREPAHGWRNLPAEPLGLPASRLTWGPKRGLKSHSFTSHLFVACLLCARRSSKSSGYPSEENRDPWPGRALIPRERTIPDEPGGDREAGPWSPSRCPGDSGKGTLAARLRIDGPEESRGPCWGFSKSSWLLGHLLLSSVCPW